MLNSFRVSYRQSLHLFFGLLIGRVPSAIQEQITAFGNLSSGFPCTCPAHLSILSATKLWRELQSHSERTSLFGTLCLQVMRKILLRHRRWKMLTSLSCFQYSVQVSEQQKRMETTIAWLTLIFVDCQRFLLIYTSSDSCQNDALAYLIRLLIYLSRVLLYEMILPRQVKLRAVSRQI